MVCGNRYKIQSCYYYLEMPANKTWDFFFYLDKICLLLGTHIQKLSSGMYTFYLYNVFAIQQNHYRAIKSSFGLSGLIIIFYIHCSVAQLCLTLCDPMNHSTPSLPVYHQLLESTQTHVHWVGDAIQPSHPLSSPSPPALNLSEYQGLFKWVSSLYQVAKVLEFQLQHQSYQWTPRTDLL